MNGKEVAFLILPKLKGLKPTMESTMIKLCEEIGELATEVGKNRNMNKEGNLFNIEYVNKRIAEELFDVAQTAVTFLFIMGENGTDLKQAYETHIEKMKAKKYLI